jgi:hypothetical protein
MTSEIDDELKAVGERLQREFDEFVLRCEAAFQEVFDAARRKNEAYFAFGLLPEF